MRKRLLCLGLAFLTGISLFNACGVRQPGVSTNQRTPNKYEIAQRQTVLVVTDRGQGSAVLVKRRTPTGQTRWFAFTAQHVIENASEIKIKAILRTEGRKVGESVYSANLLSFSEPIDAALLFVDAPADAFLSAVFASNEPARPGDPIFHCGNFRGVGFDGSISVGVISQVGVRPPSPSWPWAVADQSTAPAYPGSSGGPVFNSRGEVLGLLVGGYDATLNVFVPVRAITPWVFAWALRGDSCPSDAVGKYFVSVSPKPAAVTSDSCCP